MCFWADFVYFAAEMLKVWVWFCSFLFLRCGIVFPCKRIDSMDKEALLKGIKDALGSTKLQFSDRTLDDYCSAVVKTIEGREVSDDFASLHADILKSFNGQYHSDFAAELKKMRELDAQKGDKTDAKDTKSSLNNEDVAPKWFEDYRSESDKRIAEMESRLRKADEARAISDSRKRLEDDVRARLSKGGIRINEYVLKNSLRDVDVKSDDAAMLAEQLYNDGIKELSGTDVGFPVAGLPVGGSGSSDAERWFARRHGEA